MYVKNIVFGSILPLSAAALFLFTSCDKDDDDNNSNRTVTETVVANPDFSLLETAVGRAQLATYLGSTNNITVFAPTNDAFTAAGLTESAIGTTPVATLDAVLKYHVLAQRIPSSSVPAGPNAEVTTVNGAKAYVTRNNNGVFINGIKVAQADVNATNGVIHVIGSVLMPPSGNIVETAVANSNLTYLVAAVQRAGASGTDIAAALSAAGPLTVFAPTNQAFIDAGFPTIASIQSADPNTIKNILLYHVLNARVFSSDLTEGATPATLQGGNVTITLAGGAKVKGAGNSTAAAITGTNIVATNGVIHVIDKVLLP
ncbi:MAG: beta-Ig-H3/fasciclin [Sphingobacteriales bacterium SCN 48-20]|uniref:fasciclin domain-containing protein n=1 Tax=Terrimonas ferruginea TaxID=249 RepID=UPI00086B635F|nr:fasciclin domain-containing protein [Terrimonas ferruginea]MBN8784748.1 fasciclin domain-containing protein [Terrimonas ferruginea]ODT91058.1 MAG: beta-Ig-H3/fasciclin [Sphingobacteriales bacterium SCN 48-20]OJW45574.1 MAG: beta-Ig-H3/fasciclin [Sphingobacteriales bacterium 48-107]